MTNENAFFYILLAYSLGIGILLAFFMSICVDRMKLRKLLTLVQKK